MKFPEGKAFAFSVFDDTDLATVENIKPIYDLLRELGILTTKSVWALPPHESQGPYQGSQTLSDPDYLAFIRDLQMAGFEIAFHNATMDSSTREATAAALERFKELLGAYPRVHVNHDGLRENLYWGQDRLDSRLLRRIVGAKRQAQAFGGHRPDSPYFWGDLCQQHITYVRNLVFREINLCQVNPTMPYRDPRRPFVNYWFSSSEGATVSAFNRLLRPENQAGLERAGGVCIAYTHFAARGFVERGQVNPETRAALVELAGRNGWFVPVGTLLDHLRTQQQRETRTFWERTTMEWRWVLTKLLYGTS